MTFPIRSLTTPSRFARYLRGRQSDSTRYVGIDIGLDCIRIASFGRPRVSHRAGRSAEPFCWRSWHEIPLRKPSAGTSTDQWVKDLALTIDDQMPRSIDGELLMAAISIPHAWVHYETCGGAEIAAVQSRLERDFSRSFFRSGAQMNSWAMDRASDKHVVSAIAKSIGYRVAAAVSAIGYQVSSLLPQPVAMLHCAPLLTGLRPRGIVWLDPDGGYVIVSNQGLCGLCRSLPACPISMDENLGNINEHWLSETVTEITTTLRFAPSNRCADDRLEPLLIAGPVAALCGMDVRLAAMLNHPVSIWRYIGQQRPKAAVGRSSDRVSLAESVGSDATRAVAISLAVSAASSDQANSQ